MSAQKKVKKKKKKKNRFYPVTNGNSVQKELVINVQTSNPEDDDVLFQPKKKYKSRTKLVLEQHLASGDCFEENDEDFDLSEIQVIII